MARNEAETRFYLIDPILIDQRGWSREDIRVEQTAAQIDIVYGKGRRRPAGRTDYLLCRPLAERTEPIPLAIIEAKREDLPPEHGLQQGKGYRIGKLHHVPFVFSSNGHQFVEYDDSTGLASEARPMSEFPRPEELTARYLAARQITAASPMLPLLTTPYAQGRDFLRYYQDAAIRAAAEQLIGQTGAKKLPRVMLPLATGAGKTRLAAALLRKLFDAGKLGKALFLCDRTELRDNGLGDFQAAFGNDAAEVDTRNPQINARVLIATYQTLDHGAEDAKFFLKHYPPGFFDVIVIDECHRSAWGEWHAILASNRDAIQIGLTATPRHIRVTKEKEIEDEETAKGIEEDERKLADNFEYFGEPPYEYPYAQGVEDGYLAPAEIEQYDVYHDDKTESERVRGVRREDIKDKKLTNAYTGTPVTADAVPDKSEGGALEARLILPQRVQAMCHHLFARLLKTGGEDPLQKTIIFLRPYLNKVWIADFDGLCSVDQYVFTVRQELADTKFVASFMRSETYISRAPIGETPGQLPRIRTEEVAAVEINLPPLGVQRRIAARLDAERSAAAALRVVLAAKLAGVQKLPAALLRAAFNGSA